MPYDRSLHTFRLESGVSIAQAYPWLNLPVSLDSPALEVVTDLTLVKAATIHPGATLRQAEQAMIHLGLRMLFVVSGPMAFDGLVTSTDLHGDRLVRLVQERKAHYDDLSVADVMTGLSMLDAIDYDALKVATVGSLIATLKRFGRNHMLVIQQSSRSAPRQVRGVISRSQIERQLGETIDVTPIAHTFSEIERAFARS